MSQYTTDPTITSKDKVVCDVCFSSILAKNMNVHRKTQRHILAEEKLRNGVAEAKQQDPSRGRGRTVQFLEEPARAAPVVPSVPRAPPSTPEDESDGEEDAHPLDEIEDALDALGEALMSKLISIESKVSVLLANKKWGGAQSVDEKSDEKQEETEQTSQVL
jgi:hypothetical protein